MIPPNDIQDPSEKASAKKDELFEIEYEINLTHHLINSLKKFCERMDITEDDLINKLLKMHLEEIESGINSKNYELILHYYGFSDLLEQKKDITNKIINEKSNQKITIKISKEMNNAIVDTCKIIGKVSTKILIEDAVEYQFRAIMDNIKNGHYGFLNDFYDFQK